MAVYFAHDTAADAVKIGYSGDAVGRVRRLRGPSGGPLTLAGHDPAGDRLTEAELHHRFRHLALGKERFRDAPDLRAVVEAVAATGRVPGGWYVPARAIPKCKRDHPYTVSAFQIYVRYDLEREAAAAFVAAICRTPEMPPRGCLPIRLIPFAVEALNRHRVAVHPDHFFDHRAIRPARKCLTTWARDAVAEAVAV